MGDYGLLGKEWMGCDLMHDDDAPVRIHQYYFVVKYGNGIGDINTLLSMEMDSVAWSLVERAQN
jgi:hypothetical protein